MLGFYDYTVWLTYLSLLSSLVGLGFASEDMLGPAIICLALSGLFDGFDGKVARTKKDRTEEEKRYGIQIDSLADVVCFGVLPAMIGFRAGMNDWPGRLLLLFFALAGLIRLAYFNVTEETRQKQTADNRRYYQGVPITTSSVLVPVWYILCVLFPQLSFVTGMYFLIPLLGLFFILPIKVKKPGLKELLLMIAVVGALGIYLIVRLIRG